MDVRRSRHRVLLDVQGIDLVQMGTLEEIKVAVWSCGSKKTPGPDGFTFSFIKKLWEILKLDILNFVNGFLNKARISSECNSSFITLIRKHRNLVVVNDFPLISFIGVQYNIFQTS